VKSEESQPDNDEHHYTLPKF